MTPNKHFKALIRARMAKTGESYSISRRQLLGTLRLIKPELVADSMHHVAAIAFVPGRPMWWGVDQALTTTHHFLVLPSQRPPLLFALSDRIIGVERNETMALVAHPDRDNVWVKPELIKPEWTTQEWIRPESGFEFLSKEPAWKGMARAGYDGSTVNATDSSRVSVTIDIRPVPVQIG